MTKNLVIVESPAKAKTISKYLGKDFTVKASMGHIIDLPTKELGVDIENDFKPKYQVSKDKNKIVSSLKSEAKLADKVWLATDEDREGEAISWHISNALKLKTDQYERIVFHEITKTAIQNAIENPRKININLVNAQQARRIIDRLVGYKLSPLLWKKVRKGLSAGRVQSVAVRFVVEREKEIQDFIKDEFWKIKAYCDASAKQPLVAQLTKIKNKKAELTTKPDILKILKQMLSPKALERLDESVSKDETEVLSLVPEVNTALKVESLTSKKLTKRPSAPFITSTLQQEAHRKFGFSVGLTMKLAQQLYEGVDVDGDRIGLITYMRTDSVNLADESLQQIKHYIHSEYGAAYAVKGFNKYKTKAKGAQEAHEAIRPVNIGVLPKTLENHLDRQLVKLYTLIWKRTVATQMNPAQIEQTTAVLHLENNPDYQFEAVGKVLKFDGFMKLYIEDTDEEKDEEEGLLPHMKEGQLLPIEKIDSTQHFTKPPARYTEASLVKKLESEGIGRPSTFAPTISTIVSRGYIEKEKKQLMPTELAVIVNSFLMEYFKDIVDYKFTASIEEQFDEIAVGGSTWNDAIRNFYQPFQTQLDYTYKNAKKYVEETDEECPTCGKPLVIRMSKFGRFYSCSNFPECNYTRNLEQTKQGGQAPDVKSDEICPKCGEAMVFKKGRYGQFLACSNYPDCKFTQAPKKIIKEKGCPECQGNVVEKRTKRGKVFYGCDQYPDCKFAVWNLEDL